MTHDVEATDASPEERARATEAQMTDDERFLLILGVFGQHRLSPVRDERIPERTTMSAGYTPGVPRLGVPALQMSDASMGITNPGYAGREGDTTTAMPAAVASMCNSRVGTISREIRATGATSSTSPKTRGTAPFSPPSRSTAFRPRA